MNTVVAIRGDFDARFPDLKGFARDANRVPGRDLAKAVADGLRKADLTVAGPEYDEPFFRLWCDVRGERVQVLCYIHDPGSEVWAVEALYRRGLLARLRKQPEPEGLKILLVALYEVLLRESRVHEMRWFSTLPAEPFGQGDFARGPFAG